MVSTAAVKSAVLPSEGGRVQGDEQGVLAVPAAGRVVGVEEREDRRADQHAGDQFEGEGDAGTLGTAERQRHHRRRGVGGGVPSSVAAAFSGSGVPFGPA